MSKNKKELFKKNRETLSVDGEWESIAEEIAVERDNLKKEIASLKNLSSINEIIEVDTEKCRNWNYADRSHFELGDIEDLAEDIKTNGQLQPAIIRKIDGFTHEYEIICGERRWRACTLVDLSLKAIVVDKDDLDCMVIQTSENKKQQLSPYSLAKVYLKMLTNLKISQNELSKRLNIPKSSFSELMSFNKVPQELWDEVNDMSLISAKTASYLSKLCDKSVAYQHALLSISHKIREGSGEATLNKLIEKIINNSKTARSSSKVYENSDGELLFRLTSEGRISLSKSFLKIIDLDALAEHVKKFMLEKT